MHAAATRTTSSRSSGGEIIFIVHDQVLRAEDISSLFFFKKRRSPTKAKLSRKTYEDILFFPFEKWGQKREVGTKKMSGCQTTRADTAMTENVSSSEFTFTIILTIIISVFVPGRSSFQQSTVHVLIIFMYSC